MIVDGEELRILAICRLENIGCRLDNTLLVLATLFTRATRILASILAAKRIDAHGNRAKEAIVKRVLLPESVCGGRHTGADYSDEHFCESGNVDRDEFKSDIRSGAEACAVVDAACRANTRSIPSRLATMVTSNK
jgi:hypothetical protein